MTTDAVGGVWTYAIELARALRSVEIRVTLANLGPPPREPHVAALAALGDVDLELHEGRLEWMDGCEDDLARAGEWLLALERRLAPDLVHLNGYAHAALPWRAPTLVVAHSCVSSWWRAVHRAPAPARYAAYRSRVQAGLRRADAVVAPSAWMRDQLREYGCESTRVIYNGRRATELAPAPKSKMILAAGRMWDPAKNLAALDTAGGAVPWPILVAGETRPPSDARPSTGARQPRHLASLGSLASEELGWWLAHASIFAHPARYEPFGLAPLEAGLCGCALVLGDIASLREIWADAAVYVDPEDPDALAATLRELIRDDDRRRTMAHRARSRAGRYCVARMLAAYHDLYRELSARPSAADRRPRSCVW